MKLAWLLADWDYDGHQILLNGLGNDWKMFIQLAGVEEHEINACIANNPDVKDQAYPLLHKKLNKCPLFCWNHVKKILKLLEKDKLITKLENMMKSNGSGVEDEAETEEDGRCRKRKRIINLHNAQPNNNVDSDIYEMCGNSCETEEDERCRKRKRKRNLHNARPNNNVDSDIYEMCGNSCGETEADGRPAGKIGVSNARLNNNVRSKIYEMYGDPCGKCIIFNQNFSNTPKRRHGTGSDRDRLKRLFLWLKFKVKIYEDNKKDEMEEILKDEALDEKNEEFQCLVVCILSHGEEGVIYIADGKSIELNEILNRFNVINCKSLENKPKIFIVQACRNKRPLNYITHTVASENNEVNTGTNDTVAINADQVLYQSTSYGSLALRHPIDGSPFIQTFCEVCEERADKDSFYELALEINSRFGATYQDMCSIELNRLRKKLYFKPDSIFGDLNLVMCSIEPNRLRNKLYFKPKTPVNVTGAKTLHDHTEDVLKQDIDWKKVGRRAGLPEHIITTIESDHRGNYEKIYQCIQKIEERSKVDLSSHFLADIKMRFQQGLGPSENLVEVEFNHLDLIADVMTTLNIDWEKIGLLAGLQKYKVDAIKGDNDNKYERAYQTLYSIEQTSSTRHCDLLFWKKLLEKVERGQEAVIILGNHPFFGFMKENADENSTMHGPSRETFITERRISDEDVKRMLIDEISSRVTKWRTLGSILSIPETSLNDIENSHKGTEKRAFQCLIKAASSVQKNWIYWKTHLIQFDEGKRIALDLESRHPKLAELSKIEPECHNFIKDGTGHLLHHYGLGENVFLDIDSGKELILRFDFKNSDKESVEFAVKHETIIKKMKEKLNDVYSDGFNKIIAERSYDFTGKVETTDQIIASLKGFFKKHNYKCGFVLKDYNILEHYSLFGTNICCPRKNEKRYTAFFPRDSVVLHAFVANEMNVYKVSSSMMHEIQLFRSTHSFIEEKGLIHIAVVLFEGENIEDYCNKCQTLGLIIPIEDFQSTVKFEEWYQSILTTSKEMKQLRRCAGQFLGSEYSPSVLSNMLAENIAAFITIQQCRKSLPVSIKSLKQYVR